jgi:hypothetical protein
MILSKPVIMNSLLGTSSNNFSNNNEIININMKKIKNQILNADLLSKRIRFKLKSKEIGNKNVKLAILRMFNNLNKKYKTINTANLNNKNKYKVNNWYDIINILDVNSEIVSYNIIIKGRISSRVGASRTKTYLYKTNTKQLSNLSDFNINKLILKNGSIGINIRIDSLLAIRFNSIFI